MTGWWSPEDARRSREQDGIELDPCFFCHRPFDGSELAVLVWDRTWAHESCQQEQEVSP